MNFKSHIFFGTIAGASAVSFATSNITGIASALNSISGVTGYEIYIPNMSPFVIGASFFALLIGSVSNDLDNPSSKIGKLMPFISLPAFIISVLLRRFLYPLSWRGMREVNPTGLFEKFQSGIDFWKKILTGNLSSDDFFSKRAKVSHRMVFHTEIGIIIFGFAFWLAGFPFWYFAFFTVGYIIHLICDALVGRVPLPVMVRGVFMLLRIRREMYGVGRTSGPG